MSTPSKLSMIEFVFTQSYIETALWSSIGDDSEPLDKNHSAADLATETRDKMATDCIDFQAKYGHLYDDARQAGHDFWLTRNGHGAGFWDGDYPEPQATELTEASKTYGEYNLYIGDDGRLYGS